jgi:putative PIN family toxin of toxin-antitoxin system
MRNKKIILDTNLWISFLITKKLIEIDNLIENKKITLIFSDELIAEFVEVVQRPKFEKYFSKEDIEKILNYFDQFGKLIKVKSDIQICRDEKDNFLLNLSVDSKADYLITGDSDLLVLEKIERTKIMNFTEFVKHLG